MSWTIGILVVVAEGELAVDICSFGIDGHVQVIGHSGDLLGVQQIQRLDVGVGVHALLRRQLGQGVLEGGSIQALVVGVGAGVYNGDPGARAGVALGPGQHGAGLAAGGGHVDLIALFHGLGHILLLDQDPLNTGDGLDGLDLTVAHIGGDQVGGQGQVPDHIQLAASGLLDPGDQPVLVGLQARPVGHRGLVGGDVQGAEARADGGGLLQDDGYPDHIGVDPGLHGSELPVIPLERIDGNSAVVHLGDGDAGLGRGSGHGDRQTGQQRDHQQQ